MDFPLGSHEAQLCPRARDPLGNCWRTSVRKRVALHTCVLSASKEVHVEWSVFSDFFFFFFNWQWKQYFCSRCIVHEFKMCD